MELFKVEPGLMIWTALAFGILLLLLWRFTFKPLVGVLEEREQKIADSLDKADKTRQEAERLLEEYKKQMAESRVQSQKIIEEGKKTGEKTKQDIVLSANSQAEDILEKAKKQIDKERQKAVEEIQKVSADLVIAAASQVIEKSLTKEDHERLIEKYLSEVKLN